jgi:hypothetical protein
VIAGIDFSTKAVDVVLLDEDSDAATWHRFELEGQDAFDRARFVRRAMWSPASSWWDDVLAVGIEDPRGYNAGVLYRVQGAILACIPNSNLVQPWIPSEWRRQVGLPGNASKNDVWVFTMDQRETIERWPQDACDAYCIALATRQRLEIGAAA